MASSDVSGCPGYGIVNTSVGVVTGSAVVASGDVLGGRPQIQGCISQTIKYCSGASSSDSVRSIP